MKPLSSILIILTFISCGNLDQKGKEIEMNQDVTPYIRELKSKILLGDKNAYYELNLVYIDYSNKEDLLPYALIMSNKYNHESAYMDVYHCFSALNDKVQSNAPDYSLDSLDIYTRNIAIDYLHYAYMKNRNDATFILSKYYKEGKYVRKDALIAEKLLTMYNSDSINSKNVELLWIKERKLIIE